MSRLLPVAASVLSLALSSEALAQGRGVGLGAAAGVAVPADGKIDWKPAFNWGFFVDIPLLYTFHITPSTLLYRLRPSDAGSLPATDVSLNFKFIVPLGLLDIFGGATVGLTSTTELHPHLGVLAGASINLVSNIDVFVQGNYKWVIQDETTIRDLQIYAGPLFRFQ